jgi:ribosome-binding factor A
VIDLAQKARKRERHRQLGAFRAATASCAGRRADWRGWLQLRRGGRHLTNRTARVSEEIKKEVSDIIRNVMKDPRLPQLLSILHVDVTNDFSYAKIYYSVMSESGGDGGEEKEIGKALGGAAGFIRRELGSRLKLRRTPELHFVLDHSIERVINMNQLINETIKSDAVRYGKQ